MSAEAFLDTNVLVYAFDRSDPARHEAARRLVGELIDSRRAVVSVQVLKEFYVVSTRKVAAPLSHDEAVRVVEDLARLTVVEDSLALLARALELAGRNRISLWDASIVAAAAAAGCGALYSEDLAAGATLGGVRVVNPFA